MLSMSNRQIVRQRREQCRLRRRSANAPRELMPRVRAVLLGLLLLMLVPTRLLRCAVARR